MRVVCLPRREEHGQHGNQGSEGANLGGAVADGGRLEQAGEGAVERVNAVASSDQSRVLAHWACCHVLEELAERAGRAGAARLLAVDVVHGRVSVVLSAPCRIAEAHWGLLRPHAKREAVVDP